MSSVVNKSQKRFMPKASGPAKRRLSMRFSQNLGQEKAQVQAEVEARDKESDVIVGIEADHQDLKAIEDPVNVEEAIAKPSESIATPPPSQPTRGRTRLTSLRPRSAPVQTQPVVNQPKRPQSAPEDEYTPPEGCEFVDLTSLHKLRMNERRRKIAFEREFVSIMRELYAKKEHERLSLESDLSDEYIAVEANDLAQRATYHQLKQAVGPEAKELRDLRHQDGETETGLKPVINEKKTTMAVLCKDLPIGDTNSAFDDYELARVNRRRDTMRVFKAKMWSRGLYQPKEDEKTVLQEAYRKHRDDRQDRSGKIKTEQQQKFTELDSEAMSAHPQAAIEIQADGNIQLVGTQYDRHKNNRAQNSGPKTEVDPTEQVINSFSFSTKERSDRWTKEETEKFYEAVSALGTDFNLIAHLFPTRSRNQIKTKFKYEERRNPAKLQIHMVSRRKFNLDSYSRVSNVDIQEIDTIESELEKIRREHREQMKVEETARNEAKVEDRMRVSERST